MQVGKSTYYDWLNRPAKVISPDELKLRRRMKQLFERSRDSLGSREMAKVILPFLTLVKNRTYATISGGNPLLALCGRS